MNPTLIKKPPRTESERILQHREHEKEYMKRHKTVCVTLSKEKDSDILDWLSKKENKSEAIRHALRTASDAERLVKEYKKQKEDSHARWWENIGKKATRKEEEEC